MKDKLDRLEELVAELKSAGVVDVKFATAKDFGTVEKLADDMITVLEAMLRGDCTPAPPFGDSMMGDYHNDTSGVFLDGFSNRADILNEFSISPKVISEYKIIVAVYDLSEAYSGDAFILMEKDGQLYEVNDSHCSCYGLENFDIEETTADALRIRCDSDWPYGAFKYAIPHILEYLNS